MSSEGYVQFQRNPIASVVCQLRFHPILRISSKIEGFQERVRPHFPKYEPQTVQQFQFNIAGGAPGDGASVEKHQKHQFSTLDDRFVVSLSENDISLSSTAHANRGEFQHHLRIALEALDAEFHPIASTRFGLRYVNHIYLGQVSEDLERIVGWNELIAPDFLALPEALAHLQEAQFMSHVMGAVEEGSFGVRFGITLQPPGRIMYLLDLDRAEEGSISTSALMAKADQFANDIYSLYRSACGPALIEWMQPVAD